MSKMSELSLVLQELQSPVPNPFSTHLEKSSLPLFLENPDI